MAKPADIKKRARRLAQEGKIVDAIRVLEELSQSDAVDPYDLVTLGDLCMRGGRVQDATNYYERAVQTYREAALLRNGIALCRKVIRSQTGDNRFLLLLAELCEREGLVLDAVASYLEFAETLNPDEATGEEEWLDSLARLTPKNVELLTRQAELLVRWNRAHDAVSILRYGAESTTIAEDRDRLLQMAEQMAVLDDVEAIDAPLDAAGDGAGVDDLSDWIGGSVTSDPTPSSELRDLDIGELAAEPAAAASAGELDRDDVHDLDLEPPSTLSYALNELEDVADSVAAEAPATETPDPDAPSEDDFILESPIATAGSPEPGVVDVSDSESEFLDIPEIGAEADEATEAEETETVEAAPESTSQELAELQEALKADPFNVDLLEKLLVCYEAEQDILSSLDLRERLAQAYVNDGEKQKAFEHYRQILRVEPSHRTVRQRYLGLAEELGEEDEFADGVQKSARVNVGGMAHVEVRDDETAVNEEDMLDLGSLLTEFREGLKEGMEDATAQSYYDMGLSHMEMGLYAEAAEAFEAACGDPAIEPEARELWGRCLREDGRHDDAVRVLRAALALRPESLGVRYQLALALESGVDQDEALKLHQSIVREDPDFEDSQHRIDALGGSDCPTPPPPSYS